MATLTDKEVQELLDNPNTNPAVKQQILDAQAAVKEKQAQPAEEAEYLFVIEDYHPICGRDYAKAVFACFLAFALLVLFIWIL